jgi:hypothetical protein
VDAARQVVRWSIPGSIFVLFFSIFQLLTVFIRDHSLVSLDHLPETQKTAVGLAAALVSTIPLGFLIYQLYHFRYMRGTPLIFTRLALRDRGADILRALPDEVRELMKQRTGEVPVLKDWYMQKRLRPIGPSLLILRKEYRTRSGREYYRESRQRNWSLLRAYLDIVCIKTESTEFKSEYTTVSDIYHAQGASRISVLLAWVVYIAFNAIQGSSHLHQHLGTRVIALAVASGIAAFFWYILTEARFGTYSTLDDTLRYTLVWLSKESWVHDSGAPST